nr:embryogenesis-associated protein EMB8-like [Tanacetum cinerariifolium]
STPWLTSPHLQTTFLRFFGRPPVFNYRREVMSTSDGGIVALDWLARSDVMKKEEMGNGEVHQDANTPIVIVIPGLTSDSDSVYIKHLTFYMAKRGWNVVVSNHRGLGGVPLTSDFFYNGSWTNDMRKVVEHIRSQSPDVPLFMVGTSLGANMMVKYLGEDGDNILLDGAAAVCCPWDLLLCDRFIGRNAIQRFYDKALGAGLKRYAKMHQEFFTRLSDWATTQHGGHLGYFDGMDAKGIWWVRAVDEYLTVLGSSTMIRRQNRMPASMLIRPQKSLVDKDPYIGYVNLLKKTMILKITDAQGSETSSRIDSIIFFLKSSWISFSKKKI